MGRVWIGVGLLTGLLLLGLWVSVSMDNSQQEVSQMLEQAAVTVLSEDAQRGIALAAKAQERWQRNWRITASVADHAPMDEIDSLFAQMEMYEKSQNYSEFSACCYRVAQLVQAVGDAHVLNWWNLL